MQRGLRLLGIARIERRVGHWRFITDHECRVWRLPTFDEWRHIYFWHSLLILLLELSEAAIIGILKISKYFDFFEERSFFCFFSLIIYLVSELRYEALN